MSFAAHSAVNTCACGKYVDTIAARIAENMPYVYEHPDWPKLRWNDAKLSPLLAELRHRQGRLLGRMEGLGFRLRAEATLTTLTSDVIKSSAIEGERLNVDEYGRRSHVG